MREARILLLDARNSRYVNMTARKEKMSDIIISYCFERMLSAPQAHPLFVLTVVLEDLLYVNS